MPNQESLTEGEGSVRLTSPCTSQLRTVPFYIENITNFLNETAYLNEEVNCTEPSPSVNITWLNFYWNQPFPTELLYFSEYSAHTSIACTFILQFYLNTYFVYE